MDLNLELLNVTKGFGDRNIYKDLSYTFTTGCYAVYGKNGVGKSVLLEMIAGVARQERGVIRLSSTMLSGSLNYKMKIAYVPSAPSFFPMVDGSEFLSFIRSLKQPSGSLGCLQKVVSGYKLQGHLSSRFSQMSLGTQKKLFLATLAIGDNNLIVLDEPTNGLDDESIQFLIEQISELSQYAIVIIATHDSAFMSAINHKAIHLDNSPITSFTAIKKMKVN